MTAPNNLKRLQPQTMIAKAINTARPGTSITHHRGEMRSILMAQVMHVFAFMSPRGGCAGAYKMPRRHAPACQFRMLNFAPKKSLCRRSAQLGGVAPRAPWWHLICARSSLGRNPSVRPRGGCRNARHTTAGMRVFPKFHLAFIRLLARRCSPGNKCSSAIAVSRADSMEWDRLMFFWMT